MDIDQISLRQQTAKPSTAASSNASQPDGLTRGARFRRLVLSSAPRDRTLGDSGLLNMQIWFERNPWRPAAGWAAIAGLLAGGLFAVPTLMPWAIIVLLLLLVDPLWGSLWRLASGRAEVLPLQSGLPTRREHASAWRLPYLQEGSPAARLLDRNTSSVLPVLGRVALPSTLLSLLVASALGREAIFLTLVVLVLVIFGWLSTRRVDRVPVLLHSLVSIGLPWLLALWVIMGSNGGRPQAEQLLLVALWVVHQWGVGRAIRFDEERFGLIVLGLADMGILLLLIWAQSPLWLALWLLLTLPTWLFVYSDKSLRQVGFWQLLAMLGSAAGLAQVL